MPLLAVLSDVHGNLEALDAVLTDLEREGADGLVHLGDAVGYNADPRECLEILRRKCITAVLGNHDQAMFLPESAAFFNPDAREALAFSRSRLEDEDIRYLMALPKNDLLDDHTLLCHGSPEGTSFYILDSREAGRAFRVLEKDYPSVRLCLFGHTHIPDIWVRDPGGKISWSSWAGACLVLEEDRTYLVNPGSVGQPRNHDPRAAYLLLDSSRKTLRLRSVVYDIPTAQRKILEARLPPSLAHRLQYGI